MEGNKKRHAKLIMIFLKKNKDHHMESLESRLSVDSGSDMKNKLAFSHSICLSSALRSKSSLEGGSFCYRGSLKEEYMLYFKTVN